MQSLLVPDGRRPEVASWDKEPEQSGRVSRIDPKIKKKKSCPQETKREAGNRYNHHRQKWQGVVYWNIPLHCVKMYYYDWFNRDERAIARQEEV